MDAGTLPVGLLLSHNRPSAPASSCNVNHYVSIRLDLEGRIDLEGKAKQQYKEVVLMFTLAARVLASALGGIFALVGLGALLLVVAII
jgi:hypothetical protein